MKSKIVRHREILGIVTDKAVGTQAELRRVLSGRGHRVDQATLSRDIRELGLVKVANSNGGYKYARVDEVSPIVRTSSPALAGRMIRSVATSRNLVVVKTDPGLASALGLAFDHMNWNEVLGTVAGDDTLLLVVDEKIPARKIAKKVQGLIP